MNGGRGIQIYPLDVLVRLAARVAEQPVDAHVSLIDQGFDSLALLDLLTLIEDEAGFSWSLTSLDSLDRESTLFDYHQLYLRTAVHDDV